ncbi:MAG: hypothetical protein R8G33_07030 [Gammaproteobacteria bacterium]|nr:hypothetical protein [Gammaproteobacteria bacterium]
MTFLRVQCDELIMQNVPEGLFATKLNDSDELVFTNYLRIDKVRLVNIGGNQIIQCDSYRFPEGITVMVSADGHTCEILGVPTTPQARTNGYVIARNKKGSSLAIVPISVNALVLRE